MPDWPTIQDRLDRDVRTTLGEALVYTAPGGSPETIQGTFNDAAEYVDISEGIRVSSYRPVAGVRIADLAAAPVENATVTVRGNSYTVSIVESGKTGWAELILEET